MVKKKMKSESGFSTVEVIVATLLLSFGILGVARTSADMTRVLSDSDRAATAAMYSQERVERLRSVGCDAMAAGSEAKPGRYQLSWTINQPNGQMNVIRMLVSYPTDTGTRTDSVETAVSCL